MKMLFEKQGNLKVSTEKSRLVAKVNKTEVICPLKLRGDVCICHR